eukprot:CAMPEP_0119117132 /NCGR_PEP_ID=MMETSP1180-20130426/52671_1 /TAXON_ID=3052 ORGANISM="Chlamydomonas cf sp, Strain CCMP681" /NCGR_SAMPLE_ID=MMETSP1180 /ASSEMBLY_ACC=CAM_ASM_000741 /LENGTH=52 /DNA_ID=CAMNT_0007106355 /DNA_START=1839 /DNA_END=1997 /DNA_ORIENTATION=+
MPCPLGQGDEALWLVCLAALIQHHQRKREPVQYVTACPHACGANDLGALKHL